MANMLALGERPGSLDLNKQEVLEGLAGTVGVAVDTGLDTG